MSGAAAKVTATVANREFSKVLERVLAGETVTITKQGKSVATINPVSERDEAFEARREAFLERLRTQPMIKVARGTRDELYED